KHQLAANAVLDPLPLLTELAKRDRAQEENAGQSNEDSCDHGVCPRFSKFIHMAGRKCNERDGNGVVKGPTSQQSAISGYAFCNKDFRMLGQQYLGNLIFL